jgi:hypothetical protein
VFRPGKAGQEQALADLQSLRADLAEGGSHAPTTDPAADARNAIDLFRHFIDSHPGADADGEAKVEIATREWQLGQTDAAYKDCDSVAADFSHPQAMLAAYDAKAKLLVKDSRYAEAEDIYKWVAAGYSLKPQGIEARMGLAETYGDEGKFGEADAAYARIAADTRLGVGDIAAARAARAKVKWAKAESGGLSASTALALKEEARREYESLVNTYMSRPEAGAHVAASDMRMDLAVLCLELQQPREAIANLDDVVLGRRSDLRTRHLAAVLIGAVFCQNGDLGQVVAEETAVLSDASVSPYYRASALQWRDAAIRRLRGDPKKVPIPKPLPGFEVSQAMYLPGVTR